MPQLLPNSTHTQNTHACANTNRHTKWCISSNLTQWRAITVCTEAAGSEEMGADGDRTLVVLERKSEAESELKKKRGRDVELLSACGFRKACREKA